MPKPTPAQIRKRFRRTPPRLQRVTEHTALVDALVDLALKINDFFPDSPELRVVLNNLFEVLRLSNVELSERT